MHFGTGLIFFLPDRCVFLPPSVFAADMSNILPLVAFFFRWFGNRSPFYALPLIWQNHWTVLYVRMAQLLTFLKVFFPLRKRDGNSHIRPPKTPENLIHSLSRHLFFISFYQPHVKWVDEESRRDKGCVLSAGIFFERSLSRLSSCMWMPSASELVLICPLVLSVCCHFADRDDNTERIVHPESICNPVQYSSIIFQNGPNGTTPIRLLLEHYKILLPIQWSLTNRLIPSWIEKRR